MTAFKRLTDAEARTLTRGELLDRIEAEQTYWHLKEDQGPMSTGDRTAFAEFRAIMHRHLNLTEALDDAIALVQGRPGAGGYWDVPVNTPPADSTDQECTR